MKEIYNMELKSVNGMYIAIYNGIYYKLNENTYTILYRIKNGEIDVDEIALHYNVSPDSILMLVSTITSNKGKKRSIQELFKICPSNICNVLGRFFSFLFYKYLVACMLVLFACVLICYLCIENLTLIYDNITYIHYIIVLLSIMVWHEIGHITASYLYGIKDLNIYCGLFYIVPTIHVNLNPVITLPRKQKLIIDIAGLYFQILLFIFLYILSLIWSSDMLKLFMNLNLIIALYNMIPFFVTDGYWFYSDLLGIDNLNKLSNKMIRGLFRLKLYCRNMQIIVYSILKLILIVVCYFLLIKIVYNRASYFQDMYYKLLETNFGVATVGKTMLLLLPFILLLLFSYKKMKSWMLNK